MKGRKGKRAKSKVLNTSSPNNKEDISSLNSSETYCIPECLYDGHEGDQDMLHCCTCMQMVHPICCDDPISGLNFDGICNCIKCRTLYDRVQKMESQLNKMYDLNKSLQTMVETTNAECRQITSLLFTFLVNQGKTDLNADVTEHWSTVGNKKRRRAISGLLTDLKSSRAAPIRFSSVIKEEPKIPDSWSISPSVSKSNHVLNPMSKPFQPKPGTNTPISARSEPTANNDVKQRKRTLPPTPEPATRKSQEVSSPHPSNKQVLKTREPSISTQDNKSRITVIGNSMVRDTGAVLSKGLNEVNSCVLSKSGLTVKESIETVPKIVEGYSKTDTVVLQLGTVEVKSFTCDPFDTASNYSILLNRIHEVAPSCRVIVSAVPYLLYSGSKINQNIDHLNSALRYMCTKNASFRFWDVNPTATHRYYKSDGLHFNVKGTQIYAKNLVTKIRDMLNFPLTINRIPS